MTGFNMRLAAPFALLLGLFTVAGCSSMGRYGNYGGYGGYGGYGRGSYNYPSSARVGGSGANARYRVCHRGQAKVLPAPAVDAHLRHGDRFGYCGNNRGRNDRGRNSRWDNDRDRRDDDDRRRSRRDRDDDDDDNRRRGRWGNNRDNDDDNDRGRSRGRWG